MTSLDTSPSERLIDMSTTIEEAMTQAQAAKAAAAKAQELAAEAQRKADAVTAAAEARHEAARLAWAKRFTDDYGNASKAARERLTQARDHFAQIAATDFSKVGEAWIDVCSAWGSLFALESLLAESQNLQGRNRNLPADPRLDFLNELGPIMDTAGATAFSAATIERYDQRTQAIAAAKGEES
jgi:hypothetical protein